MAAWTAQQLRSPPEAQLLPELLSRAKRVESSAPLRAELGDEELADLSGRIPNSGARSTTLGAGVAPRVMGIGPAPATRKVLELTGLSIAQMDVIELNEAFAAQGLAVLRDLGIADDDPRVNPNGGAIALGHPLGASGARLATTAVNQLHATGGRYALCTMCIGVGQGIAVVLERV